MNKKDISTEEWRSYEWIIPETGEKRLHVIKKPIFLYYEKGSSCHVVTSEEKDGNIIAHCVPSVGRYGCVLRWGKDSGDNPVLFVSASESKEE